jgi:hypothetical protein
MVITIRARAAASAGEAATLAPWAASGSALARVRLCTVRGNPAARRVRATGSPMLPRPITATGSFIDQSARSLAM